MRYSDKPEPYRLYGFSGWTKTPTGALAVNEPQIAPWWYPSNDHPRDKATFDVSIAVPDGVEALSNGVLTRIAADHRRHGPVDWRSTKPQAPYLTFLTLGQYDVAGVDRRRTASRSSTRTATTSATAADAARASVERTPEIVEVLAQHFGPYPFEAQGGIVDTSLGFALENQTRPVYDAGFFHQGANT